MREVVRRLAQGKPRVLEIGPGNDPFPEANEFVDWQAWPELSGRSVHVLDINQDRLPFDDKSIDFVYCRHTLEDLYDPMQVCREMSRVGRAGYVETPSPIAECTRGVDATQPPWRGYIHHRYLIWAVADVLQFLPKVPLIEYVTFGDKGDDQPMRDLLNAGPLNWNTYFFWEGELKYHLLQHDRDFRYQHHYGQMLSNAMAESAAANAALAKQLGLS